MPTDAPAPQACPKCGAAKKGHSFLFECDSYYVGKQFFQNARCMAAERDALQRRVRELADSLDRFMADNSALESRVRELEQAAQIVIRLAEWSREFSRTRYISATEEKRCHEHFSQIETSARSFADTTTGAAEKESPDG